jgi:hypothetical protein
MLQALLAEERRCGRAREARHKLELERLRQQLREAQDSNGELRGQVQYLEAHRLAQSWGAAAASEPQATGGSRRSSAGGSGSSSSTAVHDAARGASGRRVPAANGLPAVKVERSSGSSSGSGWVGSMRAAPAAEGPQQRVRQQQALQHACWEDAAGEEEGDEQLIADVELLSDEEVVVCGEEQEEEQEEEQAVDSPQLGSMPGSMPGSCCATLQQADLHQQQPAAGAGPGAAQEAPADAVGRASSALAPFNQLCGSLTQHGGPQSRLDSRAGSLQASPLPVAGLQPVDSAAPTVDDDLRRLGRSLLAAAGAASSNTATSVQLAAPVPPPAPGASTDAVVSEAQHPDGSWERLFASGLREQRFPNGSTKQQLPGAGGASGASLTHFANGDAKKALPCGTVEYFYATVNSWQVTHPSGVDVYFFPSGQVGEERWVVRWVVWRSSSTGSGSHVPSWQRQAVLTSLLQLLLVLMPPACSALPAGGGAPPWGHQGDSVF